MDIHYSSSTCSMAEIVYLESLGHCNTLANELARQIEAAELATRKMLVANVAAIQRKNKDLMAALKAQGFKRVGMYYGNSEQMVHVYIRGLRTRATKK